MPMCVLATARGDSERGVLWRGVLVSALPHTHLRQFALRKPITMSDADVSPSLIHPVHRRPSAKVT